MDLEQRLRYIFEKNAVDLGYKDYRIQTTQVSTGGGNFSSIGYRSILSAPGRPELRLFAKVSMLFEELRLLARFDIFKTEAMFYADLLPRYRKLEEFYDVPENETLLMPKYYCGNTEYMNEVLVLEDLVGCGFRDFDRFTCVQWDYASKCVEQLAILHSLSFAHAEKYPEEFDRLTANLKSGFSIGDFKYLVERSAALSMDVCHVKNKQRLESFIKNTVNDESFEKYSNPARRPGIVHGDFRSSNIMHKMDENGNIKVVILDHQTLQRGNPLFDLMYFIGCCTDAAFRAKYFHTFLEHYYSNLSRALLRLDIEPEEVYSRKDFDADIKLFLPYALLVAVLLLPLVTVDESNVPASIDFVDGEALMKHPNSILERRLNDMVNDFIEMGVL